MTAKSATKLPTTGLLSPVTSSSPGTLPETLTDAQRWQVALLALAGALQPTPIPLTFLHKLYLRQYGWGMVYFLLGLTQIARVACAIEAVWYLLGAPSLPTRFNLRPSSTSTPTAATDLQARVTAIRALEQLRQDGLLSEYEFEQQRRQLLDG